MPPNPPPEPLPESGVWRARLERLRDCLDQLDAAMQAGHWEQLDQLTAQVNRAMRDLRAQPAQAEAAHLEALRQMLSLIDTLQTRAATRQQQIQPLLQAWRTAQPKTP